MTGTVPKDVGSSPVSDGQPGTVSPISLWAAPSMSLRCRQVSMSSTDGGPHLFDPTITVVTKDSRSFTKEGLVMAVMFLAEPTGDGVLAEFVSVVDRYAVRRNSARDGRPRFARFRSK